MYKDKPYAYPPSQRARPFWRRKRVAGAVFLKHGAVRDAADWSERRESVVDAFKLSWDAYERYAWGHDQFHPIGRGRRIRLGSRGDSYYEYLIGVASHV